MYRIQCFFAVILMLLAGNQAGQAQSLSLQQLAAYEDTLYEAFERLYLLPEDQVQQDRSAEIQEYFSRVLASPDSYHYPFDSLQRIGKIYAPDMKLRVITWNVPNRDGTHKYYGLIQHTERKRARKVSLYTLHDRTEMIDHPSEAVCTPEKWLGALYYQVHVNKHAGQEYYTLIGFDFNDRFSNRKIIDVLTIDRKNNIQFGAPLFITEDGRYHKRIIFEYSSQAVMTLRYDEHLDMIVFDHLSPIEPGLEGVYKFYGPDEYYDGYQFDDGKYVFHSDVDVRNR